MLNITSTLNELPYYLSYSQAEGWAVNNVVLKCTQCHPTCLTCTATGSDISCLTCHSADFELSQGQCLCADGFYVKIKNPCLSLPCATCEPCNPSCFRCSGPGPYACIDCQEGYVIDESKACQKCPSTTYFENDACIDCSKDCQTCTGPTKADCKSCVPSLYLNTTLCGETCPAGQVADSILNRCIDDTVKVGAEYFNTTTFTDATVGPYVSFAPSVPATLTSTCNGVKVFGVENSFGGNSLKVSINFPSLPARDSVKIFFGAFALGTWTAADLLTIYINDNPSNVVFSQSLYLANKTSPPYTCAAATE